MTDKTYLTREFVSELIDKNQYIFVDDESQDYRCLAKPLELMTDNSTSTLYWGDGVRNMGKLRISLCPILSYNRY